MRNSTVYEGVGSFEIQGGELFAASGRETLTQYACMMKHHEILSSILIRSRRSTSKAK
jgi:hypothetical protein